MFWSRPHNVWIALIAATLCAFGLQLEGLALSHRVVSSAILAIAFIKVRLIGLHYMELGATVIPLRLAFEAWVLLLAVTLITMFALA